MREEATGILAWAVRGCLPWQREGLGAPDAVRDATEAYRSEMDVLAMFFEECCVFDKRAEAGGSALYRAYIQWCDGSSEHAETQTSFGTRLRERGLVQRKAHGRMFWIGVGLVSGDSGDSGDRFSGSSHEKKTQSGKPGNWSHPPHPPRHPPSALAAMAKAVIGAAAWAGSWTTSQRGGRCHD